MLTGRGRRLLDTEKLLVKVGAVPEVPLPALLQAETRLAPQLA